MITFIAHLRVKPENSAALEALLTYVAEMTHEHEPGVAYYEFAKSVDEPDTYVVIEVYRDRDVHAAHMASAWVKESLPKSLRLIEGRPDIKQYVTPGTEPVARQTSSPQAPKRPSAAEIQEREAYVSGRPPRLPALPAHERTTRQRALFDEMSTVVVDGVTKPREDGPALEIMIRHAELYKAHLDVAQKYLSECELDIRDRELAILRIAWLSQAPFEWGAHVKIARRSGISSEEIERVIEGSSAPGWSDKDRAIVRAMEELHFGSMISDETWADLQAHYNDKKLIELIILAGQYKTVAYYQNSLRLPLPESNMGLSAR